MLGFGMVAYFRMLSSLIIIFLLFSLLIIPSLYIYSSYNGMEGLQNYSKAKYSIGNLGFSGVTCLSIYLGLGDKHMQIGCRVGTIQSLYSFGLIPAQDNN